MSLEIPENYFVVGLFTAEQTQYYLDLVEGNRENPNFPKSVAERYWDESSVEKEQEMCDDSFMDKFLELLELFCPDVITVTCMLAQTYEHKSLRARVNSDIQAKVHEKLTDRNFERTRFLVSFFNVDQHWYWYICDNFERVVYFGDSFNMNHTSAGQSRPKLLDRIITDYAGMHKMNGISFKFAAVKCPQQLPSDSTSCGQFACASVIAFMMRVYHKKIPSSQYGYAITDYDTRNYKFIKNRLVMSFAYGHFKQSLKLITYIEKKENPPEEVQKISPVFQETTAPCLRAVELEMPENFLSGVPKDILDLVKSKRVDTKSEILHLDPNYFPEEQPSAQCKAFVKCTLNPEWNFTSHIELLVAVVATFGNVTKRGVEDSSRSDDKAFTDMVISKASWEWNLRSSVLLPYKTWNSLLVKTKIDEDFSKIPKQNRYLVKSNGVWRVTEFGFNTYLKLKSNTGPCIFAEVQCCKGRKSKSSSKKAKKKITSLIPYSKPSRSVTWIEIIQNALNYTHCPATANSIYEIVRLSYEADISQIRQAITSGTKRPQKREIKFYRFEAKFGQKTQKYCGHIGKECYRNIIPGNSVYDSEGRPCIEWVKYDENFEISGCLTVKISAHNRVFYVEDDCLKTSYHLYCGTIIQYKENDIQSILNFALEESYEKANVEESTFFGTKVLFVRKDIPEGSLILRCNPMQVTLDSF